MKFVFKRKYTPLFLSLFILSGLCVAFYFIGPKFINQDDKFFKEVLLISLLNTIFIVLFVFGLYRVNYYLYHDHIEIKRSLRKPLLISYYQIKEVKEVSSDGSFLSKPSFKVKYEYRGKIKALKIRVVNHELFKTVLQNEKKIRLEASV